MANSTTKSSKPQGGKGSGEQPATNAEQIAAALKIVVAELQQQASTGNAPSLGAAAEEAQREFARIEADLQQPRPWAFAPLDAATRNTLDKNTNEAIDQATTTIKRTAGTTFEILRSESKSY